MGTSAAAKQGFTLADCAGTVGTCATPKNLFATNLTTIGGSGNSIGGTWTQTNVKTLATNATFTWDGSTAASLANVCYQHGNDGVISSTPRFDATGNWALQTALTAALTAYGYADLNVATEQAALLGTIPAQCKVGGVAATNTPTGTLTNTPTPTSTSTPTQTFTPSRTPTRTPTPLPTQTGGCKHWWICNGKSYQGCARKYCPAPSAP